MIHELTLNSRKGLGHLGLQYGKAMGMRVIAIDGGEEKGKLCQDLGAEAYLDFTKTQDLAAEVQRVTQYVSRAEHIPMTRRM